jgi:uncharacterized small protein (DUF1192 family)
VTGRKDEGRQPAQDPKKVRRIEKDDSNELQVEELEERIAPIKVL